MNPFHNLDADTKAAMYDEYYSEQEQFERKRTEILSKFMNGYNRFNNDHLFRKVVEALMRGANPFDLIEKLIDINKEQADAFKQYLNLNAYPQRIEIKKPDQ